MYSVASVNTFGLLYHLDLIEIVRDSKIYYLLSNNLFVALATKLGLESTSLITLEIINFH